MGILLALAAAVLYGSSDFGGGLASRRLGSLQVSVTGSAVAAVAAWVTLILVGGPGPLVVALAVGSFFVTYLGLGIANVIIVMVKIDTAIMNPLTWSSTSVANTRPSASASSGIVPTQNLDQSSGRISSGLDRSSQSVRPSRLIPGKMNRAAIEARTNPARMRFTNGITLARKKVTPSPRSGRNLMLNT